MKNILAVTMAVTMVSGIAGCGGDSTGSASEPIRIGAVLSLTGTYAGLGESEKNAIELEVDRINEAGGIDGRSIEVVIEDDATDEAKAVAAASKLIEQDEVVAILGASGTGQTMAMRSELQRAGVPQISMAGGTVITDQFDANVFQTPWSNRIVVPFVLDAIVEKVGSGEVVKVAVLSDAGAYGKDGLAVIEEEAAKRSSQVQIVANETFNPGDTDVSAQLTRVNMTDPDAVLLWTAGKEGATVVKNATELGLGVPLFGGSGQARLEFIEGAGDAVQGFVLGTGRSLVPENWPADSPEKVAVADFAERYEAAYGETPDIFAGHAFDAMAIVLDALKRAGAGASPDELRDAIEQTKDLAGFGGSFTFTADDHNGLTVDDLALYTVQDGFWSAED